jgi:Stage V sporulation protein AD (SpoVAD).
MIERLVKYIKVVNSQPSVTGYVAVLVKTEGDGPVKDEFGFAVEDDTLVEVSFENAESALQKDAVTRALSKAGKFREELRFFYLRRPSDPTQRFVIRSSDPSISPR